MSFDEIAAIYLYTTNYVYRAFNASLRSHNDKWRIFCASLVSGVSKLPLESKPLYRGVSYHEVSLVERIGKYYEKDVVFRWDPPMSLSNTSKYAMSSAGGKGVVFEVENG
eukprot:30632_1